MTSPDETQKPFQFGLRSIFLATAAVGVALGLLKWLGPADFTGLVIVAVQCSEVVAVLVMSRGTAWPGVVTGGLIGGLLSMFRCPWSCTWRALLLGLEEALRPTKS